MSTAKLTEKQLLEAIDHAYEMESKWLEEGQKLKEEYRRRFKKEP